MSKYQIGGLAFASKKAVADHASRIFKAAELGASLDGDDLAFASGLLARHAEVDEKVGVGVASIEVELNLEWGSRSFWLTRIDGTRTDWGVKSCLSPSTHEQNVRAALRNEVRPQTFAFRDAAFASGRVTCAVSGVELTTENVHVDHYDPTFVDLARSFLASYTDGHFALNGQGDGDTFLTIADRTIAAEWREYHQRRAKLRCVTRRVNLSDLRRRHA